MYSAGKRKVLRQIISIIDLMVEYTHNVSCVVVIWD